jgi:hypothetical protein
MALMDHTFQIELEETKKASLFNCFKGTNFRRLEIVSRLAFSSCTGAD